MNFNKKSSLKIIIGLLLLAIAFFVTFIYLGGGHLDSFGETVIIMLVVSLVMMTTPIIAWLINQKHLNRKKGLKICIANSLIIFILAAIWPVITIIKNEPCSPFNTICEVQFSWKILGIALFLAILYCLINICFWVDLCKTKNTTKSRR